ncbi:hypothetical protein YC2023_069004 [Brassica napus]
MCTPYENSEFSLFPRETETTKQNCKYSLNHWTNHYKIAIPLRNGDNKAKLQILPKSVD